MAGSFRQALVPNRVRHLHGQLVGELPFSIFWETLERNLPGLVLLRAGNNAYPHSARTNLLRPIGLAAFGRLGVLDRNGSHLPCRSQPGSGGSGNEDTRKEFRSQAGTQAQAVDAVELT